MVIFDVKSGGCVNPTVTILVSVHIANQRSLDEQVGVVLPFRFQQLICKVVVSFAGKGVHDALIMSLYDTSCTESKPEFG